MEMSQVAARTTHRHVFRIRPDCSYSVACGRLSHDADADGNPAIGDTVDIEYDLTRRDLGDGGLARYVDGEPDKGYPVLRRPGSVVNRACYAHSLGTACAR